MAQLKKVIEPFGEVNVYPSGPGKIRVTATLLMEPHRPGAKTGIALDGSGSMGNLYGINSGIRASRLFERENPAANAMAPVARKLCSYLASRIDTDRRTDCIYWASGPAGLQVEPIGELSATDAESQPFSGPKQLGTGTKLMPALRYFLDRHAAAPWGFFVFITDGELQDLDEVKQFSTQLAKDIAAGRRPPVKLVLIGLGADINEEQLQQLDDLDTGTDVDLWDHKLANELRVLEQIFAEVVDKNARIGVNGKIVGPNGELFKDYSGRGVPAFMEFEAPTSAAYFTLSIDGRTIHQGLSDQAVVPESDELITAGIEVVDDGAPAVVPPVVAPTQSQSQSQSQSAVAAPVPVPAPAPAPQPQPEPVMQPKPSPRKEPIDISIDPGMDLEIGGFADATASGAKAPTPSKGNLDALDDVVESTKKDFDALDDITGVGLDLDLQFGFDVPDIDLKKKDDA